MTDVVKTGEAVKNGDIMMPQYWLQTGEVVKTGEAVMTGEKIADSQATDHKGKSVLPGLPFFFHDTCNQQKLAASCVILSYRKLPQNLFLSVSCFSGHYFL